MPTLLEVAQSEHKAKKKRPGVVSRAANAVSKVPVGTMMGVGAMPSEMTTPRTPQAVGATIGGMADFLLGAEPTAQGANVTGMPTPATEAVSKRMAPRMTKPAPKKQPALVKALPTETAPYDPGALLTTDQRNKAINGYFEAAWPDEGEWNKDSAQAWLDTQPTLERDFINRVLPDPLDMKVSRTQGWIALHAGPYTRNLTTSAVDVAKGFAEFPLKVAATGVANTPLPTDIIPGGRAKKQEIFKAIQDTEINLLPESWREPARAAVTPFSDEEVLHMVPDTALAMWNSVVTLPDQLKTGEVAPILGTAAMILGGVHGMRRGLAKFGEAKIAASVAAGDAALKAGDVAAAGVHYTAAMERTPMWAKLTDAEKAQATRGIMEAVKDQAGLSGVEGVAGNVRMRTVEQGETGRTLRAHEQQQAAIGQHTALPAPRTPVEGEPIPLKGNADKGAIRPSYTPPGENVQPIPFRAATDAELERTAIHRSAEDVQKMVAEAKSAPEQWSILNARYEQLRNAFNFEGTAPKGEHLTAVMYEMDSLEKQMEHLRPTVEDWSNEDMSNPPADKLGNPVGEIGGLFGKGMPGTERIISTRTGNPIGQPLPVYDLDEVRSALASIADEPWGYGEPPSDMREFGDWVSALLSGRKEEKFGIRTSTGVRVRSFGENTDALNSREISWIRRDLMNRYANSRGSIAEPPPEDVSHLFTPWNEAREGKMRMGETPAEEVAAVAAEAARAPKVETAPTEGAGKQPWEMTREEWQRDVLAPLEAAKAMDKGASVKHTAAFMEDFYRRYREGPANMAHDAQVAWALRHGKNVPEEVLAQYPPEYWRSLPYGMDVAFADVPTLIEARMTAKADTPPATFEQTEAGMQGQLIPQDEMPFNLTSERAPVSEFKPKPKDTQTGMFGEEEGGAGTAATLEPALLASESGKSPVGSAIPGLNEFVGQDLAPALERFGAKVKDVVDAAAAILSPRHGVRQRILDYVMKMKGGRDKAEFLVGATLEKARRTFDGMTQQQNVDFIDRYKRGKAQPTEELQAYADLFRKLDDEMYAALKKVKPSVPYLDNHFRVMWKTIPQAEGMLEGMVEPKKGFIPGSRRPFQGTKGMLKQHSLADISEGIARGGVPASYNPVELFTMAYQDAMKYVTAQRMWNEAKAMGDVEFVRFGEKRPEGWQPINDRIAKVYFPVEEGMVNAGEYYADPGFARLMNNYLSRDLLRENTAVGHIGNALLQVKNASTAIELGFSPFHFFFESSEIIGSNIGLGVRKVLSGRIKAGVSELAGSVFSPAGAARLGGQVLKFATKPEEFLATVGGKKFLEAYPDAAAMVDDLFTGGGKLKMHQDYNVAMARSMREALAEHNYLGAIGRGLANSPQLLMKPLFETYIPRLKVGQFFKEYSFELADRANDLAAGKITRPQLAREVWDSIENRLGEMNFDNLFWDRTFKTSLQILFRSVTWKLGNWRELSNALAGQGKEIAQAVGERRIPKMHRSMGWLVGTTIWTATMGTVASKMFSGRYPWEWIDHSESHARQAAELAKNCIYPHMSAEDPDDRAAMWSYYRDWISAFHDPAAYAKGSMSSFISKTMEVYKNRDFYGTEVYSPDDPLYRQAADAAKHLFPMPFIASNITRELESQRPVPTAIAEGLTGKAPSYISQSRAEQLARDLTRRRVEGLPPRTKAQAESSKLAARLTREIRQGSAKLAEAHQAREDGKITDRQYSRIEKQSAMSALQADVSELDAKDAAKVYAKASGAEADEIRELVLGKIERSESLTDDQKDGLRVALEKADKRLIAKGEARRPRMRRAD